MLTYLRQHAMLSVAFAVAIASMFLQPPDLQYLQYFDCKTLTCLFCLLAMLCALRHIHLFPILAMQLIQKTGTVRSLILALVWITALSAMLIANDMALLLFLPLCGIALRSTQNERYLLSAFLLQNLAANLGGMITPFGSPQNLYLYTAFHIPTLEFFQILSLPFLLSMGLLTLFCFVLFPATPLTLPPSEKNILPKGKTTLYVLLFLAIVLVVFRVLPYGFILVTVPLTLLFADRSSLKETDWALLGTFAAFFLFSGNLARMEAVRTLLEGCMHKQAFLSAVLSSQVMSNVPAAILLSRFTDNARALLLGVNIGGVGTLISSLANLITLQEYGKYVPNGSKRFLWVFTGYNLIFLAVLLIAGWFWC